MICLQSFGFNYAPGATIGILPLNNAEEVDYILTRCGDYNRADKPIILESKNEKKPVPNFVPKRTTIRNILTWCLNIRTVPKKVSIFVNPNGIIRQNGHYDNLSNIIQWMFEILKFHDRKTINGCNCKTENKFTIENPCR